MQKTRVPSVVAALIPIVLSACASIPWGTTDGLKEGERWQRLPVPSAKASAQVYAATEDATVVSVTRKEARHETGIGRVVLEVRAANCPACDALEDVLRGTLPQVAPDLRWIRMEAQSTQDVEDFRVSVAPTLILLDRGQEKGRMLGFRGEKATRKFIESAFAASP